MSNRIQKSNWQKEKEEVEENKSFVFLFSGQHGKEEAAAKQGIDPPSLLSASAHFYLFIIELWEEEHAFFEYAMFVCARGYRRRFSIG